MRYLNHFLFFYLFICSFSCATKVKNKDACSFSNHESISGRQLRFSFVPKKTNLDKSIKVDCTILNESIDTAFLIGSSCYDFQYFLVFDSIRIEINPEISCNTDYPKIFKIPPKGMYKFSTFFNLHEQYPKIKIGLDAISLNKPCDLNTISLRKLYHRDKNEKIILWGNEQEIN